jgi:hypothetical protein
MAETSYYDVSGKPNGGRTYPGGTVLKLTEQQASAMGLTSKDKSKFSTTADSAARASSYERAMTSQDEMRAAAETPDAEATDAGNKARRTRG